MEREEWRRKGKREQISGTVREPFRKSRVGSECERMCECSQEEKKRTKCAKRATESRGIIKIGEGNVEERIAAWRKRSRLRTLKEGVGRLNYDFSRYTVIGRTFRYANRCLTRPLLRSTALCVTIKALLTALLGVLHPSLLFPFLTLFQPVRFLLFFFCFFFFCPLINPTCVDFSKSKIRGLRSYRCRNKLRSSATKEKEQKETSKRITRLGRFPRPRY